MPRLIVHFARFGPYHHARLRSAAEILGPMDWEVLGLETAGTDLTYAWNEAAGDLSWPEVRTAFPGRVHEEIKTGEYRRVLDPMLDSLKPDAIAIAGWGSIDARHCLEWSRKRHVSRFVMSETRVADGRRVWWKEWVKSRLIRRFDGALVGGRSHRDYLAGLGMKAERIAFGYNAVDNQYFSDECRKARSSTIEGIAPYFLASNRFIDRKNLGCLIDAYASYIEAPTQRGTEESVLNLCLLGDGELKGALIAQCKDLGVQITESAPWDPQPPTVNRQPPTVFFPGFRQIEELPRFYSHAGAFVHPALEEPWGLVLNEAMACGLPVLSSNNVGAAEELIDEGVNGWTFDPASVPEIALLMSRVAALTPDEALAMGEASVRILEERASTAAFGEGLAQLLGMC